jgi:hypothetical protein
MKRHFPRLSRRKLSAEQKAILIALAEGQTLKSHRNIEGDKVYTLHALDGITQSVAMTAVLDLRARRLIETNHKFPAATFLLTTAGTALVAPWIDATTRKPLSARNFV